MIDRRAFLGSPLALAITAPKPSEAGASEVFSVQVRARQAADPGLQYEQLLAGLKCLRVLGLPHSWSLVRDRLHPFSPDRVVIDRRKGALSHATPACINGNVWERVQELLRRQPHPREVEAFSEEKYEVILSLTEILANYYRLPECFEEWAIGLTARESLMATAYRDGCGLVHQFQNWGQEPRAVATRNSFVDWWAFLFPHGAIWDSFDGKPVYGLIGHVFSQLRRSVGLEMRVYELTSRLHGTMSTECPTIWEHISSLDRVAAAQCLNGHLAHVLEIENCQRLKRTRDK